MGALWTLLGAVVVLGGAALKSIGDQAGGTVVGDAFGGAVAGLGIVVLAIALVELIVGIAAWMGKEWARIVGIIYALIFGGGCLIVGLPALSAGNSDTNAVGGALIILAFAAAYIYTLVVFAVRWRARATA
jgi:ABC-type arginine/histidine transport system permease subunit